MLIRCAEQVKSGGHLTLKKEWTPISRISKNLQHAVIVSEDQNFLKHNGFDFDAIEKAVKYNENHERKRGASTISQQTAKNVFLWPGRSWPRKGLEAYFTFLIEICWSKERILEVYLNVIETGNGIYGAEAASQLYFSKSVEELTKAESALIAASLPNPRKYSVSNPGPYMRSRAAWIAGHI